MNTFVPNTEGIFFDLPFEEYRKAPGISQSTLKAFMAEPTPKHFVESSSRPAKSTPDMEFGTVLHASILTPEGAKPYHLQPKTYTTISGGKKGDPDRVVEKPWHGGADACKEWMKTHSDLPIIDEEQEKKIPPIIETVRGLPVAGDIIDCGQKEVSFFKRDEETGILLKCRVDAMATDTSGSTHICDLKKVRRGYADSERFAVTCVERGYDIQCASYLSITGATKFMFVAIEDEPPFEAEVYEMDKDFFLLGFSKWRKALERFAKVMASGEWHGYLRSVKKLKAPYWAKDRDKPIPESIYI